MKDRMSVLFNMRLQYSVCYDIVKMKILRPVNLIEGWNYHFKFIMQCYWPAGRKSLFIIQNDTKQIENPLFETNFSKTLQLQERRYHKKFVSIQTLCWSYKKCTTSLFKLQTSTFSPKYRKSIWFVVWIVSW